MGKNKWWTKYLAGALTIAYPALVLLAIWALTVLVFSLDKPRPEMPVAQHQLPFESRQALARLTHPVHCDATVQPAGSRARCYVKGRRK